MCILNRNNISGVRHKLDWNYNEYFAVCLRNNDSANDKILCKSDLKNYPPTYSTARTIIVETNRGFTYRMFDNPYHREKLRSYGLSPDNAFGCVMHYLFRLKPEGCDNACKAVAAGIRAAEANNVVVVGIQVRVGDSIMDGDDKTTIARARVHLNCARDISEDILNKTGRQTLFYMISDSISLLKAVKNEYGDKILVDIDTRPMNTANCNGASQCSTHDKKLKLIQHTTNQAFMFSRAHYHVVSRYSGFGMMGAWMSRRPVENRVFRVLSDKPNTVCRVGSIRDADTNPRELASDWSGI